MMVDPHGAQLHEQWPGYSRHDGRCYARHLPADPRRYVRQQKDDEPEQRQGHDRARHYFCLHLPDQGCAQKNQCRKRQFDKARPVHRCTFGRVQPILPIIKPALPV